jgi:hypothetical protein
MNVLDVSLFELKPEGLHLPDPGGSVFDARIQVIDGDLYVLQNCTYDASTGNFNRVDTSVTAYLQAYYIKNPIPGEAVISLTTRGYVFWIALPAIGTPYIANIGLMQSTGNTGAFSLAFSVTQFRDYVIGGYGIEIDGKGTVPYSRVCNTVAYPAGYGGATFAGHLINLYIDLSGRDVPADPSWFWGLEGGEFRVKYMAGSADYTDPATFVNLLRLDSGGTLRLRDIVADRSDGTGVIFLSGSGTRYLYYNGTRYELPGAGLILGGAVALPSTGAAKCMGRATLAGGTVTINTTAATATCEVQVTRRTPGGVLGHLSYSIVAGTSITITSTSPTETSEVSWFIGEAG